MGWKGGYDTIDSRSGSLSTGDMKVPKRSDGILIPLCLTNQQCGNTVLPVDTHRVDERRDVIRHRYKYKYTICLWCEDASKI